jgi:peroxisomal membrane protein 2
VLSAYLAGSRVTASKNAPALAHILAKAKIDSKAFKMALYGFAVSAPLSHYLNGTVQSLFAGKPSKGAKIGQLLSSYFVVMPIQTIGRLLSLLSDGKKGSHHQCVYFLLSLSGVHGRDQRRAFL